MFVLEELDKLLKVFADKNQHEDKFKITLADVPRVDIATFELSKKVSFPVDDGIFKTNEQDTNHQSSSGGIDHSKVSLNDLFGRMMRFALLAKISTIPERVYPSAKLIICDQSSYELMMKLVRVSPKDFLHRKPFGVTAVLKLSNLLDQFNRQKEPMIVLRNGIAVFNYPLVKRVIPYLKLSDILILSGEKIAKFEMKNSNSSDLHLLIEILARYSRSCQIIETELPLGHPHQIYDNLTILKPPPMSSQDKLPLARLTPTYLSSMSACLGYLIEQLNLSVSQIAFRTADPSGQTRLLAKLLAAPSSKSTSPNATKSDRRMAKVIVMDRLADLQSTLMHATLYGPFMEQECPVTKDIIAKTTSGKTTDDLDEKLQLVALMDALGVIVKHTSTAATTTARSMSTLVSTSGATRSHLNNVKLIYKSLSDGYLLLTRFELSLDSIRGQLGSSDDKTKVDKLLESLLRIVTAYEELVGSGFKFDPLDLTRLTCLILDTINLFVYTLNQDAKLTAAKSSLLNGNKTYKLNLGSEYAKNLQKFDKLSQNSLQFRCKLPIDVMIEKLTNPSASNDLDNSFEVVNFIDGNQIAAEVILFAFLGILTPHELGKIKLLEEKLRKSSKVNSTILIVAAGIARPDEFMAAI